MRKTIINLLMSLSFVFTQEVVVWVSNADDSHIELSMTNTSGVGGFQFTVIADASLGALFGEAFGGAAEEAGFMMSTNEEGLIIGFSLTGEEILPGDSILLANMNWTIPDDVAGYITIELIPNSFAGGNPPVALDAVIGEPYLYGDNINFGCTDPEAINYDPDATVDDGSCVYPPDPPANLTTDGGYTDISLEWDYENLYRDNRDELVIYISEIQDDGIGNAEIGLYMNNADVDIYGFQFKIYSEAELTFIGASGGRADEAGFSVTTNEDGLVLGFSFTGNWIPMGEGIFTYLSVNYSLEDIGQLSMVGVDETYPDNIFSTMDGPDIFAVPFSWIPITWTVGENFEFEFIDECGDGFCTGEEDYFSCPEDCPPPEELTFNVYRDGSLFESGIETFYYTDMGLGFLETYCYTVTAYNGAYESDPSNEACATTDPLGADIDVSPDFLSAGLFTGDMEQQSLTISNSGDDDLIWSTSIEEVDNVSRNAFNPEEIKREIRIHSEGEIVPGELIVRYRSSITNPQREMMTRMLSITREKSFVDLNLYLYHYESEWKIEEIISYLNSFNNVLYAEPSYKVHAVQTIPDDPFFDQQWGMHNTGQSGGVEDADLDGPEAWDVETGNGEITVGIIDTGIDYNHEDLQGNIWTNSGEVPNNGIDDDDNGYVDEL